MIESITIKNFQRHGKTTIELDPRVTTIIGRNDAGKSAILRALRWACLNRPNGNSFIKHGRNQSSVAIRVDNRTITRKTGTIKSYALDKKQFKAFRNSVPAEIAKFLSLDEINFQRQHQGVFWFDLTPGQTAKELNKLVDLETIDKAQTWIAKRIRRHKIELDVSKVHLAETKESMRGLYGVRQFDVALSRLEKQYSTISRIIAHASRIRDLINQAVSGRMRAEYAAGAAVGAAGAVASGMAAVGAAGAVERLAGLLGAAGAAVGAAGAVLPDAGGLESTLANRAHIEDRIQRLAYLIYNVERTEDQLCQCKKIIKAKTRKLEKQLNGKCPLCGYPLTGEQSLS